jgi:hypothetical protein
MPPLNRLDEDADFDFVLYGQENNQSCNALLEQSLKLGTRRRERKTCRFDDSVKVETVLHWKNYSKDEMNDAWYSASDYAAFKQDIAATCYLITHDPDVVDGRLEEYIRRGVECRMQDAVTRRHGRKFQARSAVLDEQEFQLGLGEPSEDWIANLYRQVSTATVNEALGLAALDQLDAERYQNEANQGDDEFNDDWISSISSDSAFARRPLEELNVLDDASGFDISWLLDVFVQA